MPEAKAELCTTSMRRQLPVLDFDAMRQPSGDMWDKGLCAELDATLPLSKRFTGDVYADPLRLCVNLAALDECLLKELCDRWGLEADCKMDCHNRAIAICVHLAKRPLEVKWHAAFLPRQAGADA